MPKGDYKYDFFLSYSNRNSAEAELIKNYLEDNGYVVWYAKEQKSFTEAFLHKIQRGIDNSACFLILFSSNYEKGSYQDHEICYAFEKTRDRRLPIVPVIMPDARELFLETMLRAFEVIMIEKHLGDELSKLDVAFEEVIGNGDEIIEANLILFKKRRKQWSFKLVTDSRRNRELVVVITNQFVRILINNRVVSEIKSLFSYTHQIGFLYPANTERLPGSAFIKLNSMTAGIKEIDFDLNGKKFTFK